MNYAYFMYTLLWDWTNTRRLNWTNFLSFLLAQLSREKINFPDSPYDRLYSSTK